jgi:formamidopyrimidine-DNA glycosylase
MPELPESVVRARQIDDTLRGRTVCRALLAQPKCLNLPADEFARRLAGQEIRGAAPRGKWIAITLSRDTLLLSLGMGGEVLWHAPGAATPAGRQATLELDDGALLSVHFWWFGYLHLLGPAEPHAMTRDLGPDPLDPRFGSAPLAALFRGRRARLKALLLDQHNIAGIGNMYVHDILFRARLHPERPALSIGPEEVAALLQGMRTTLRLAVDLGGSVWEQDLYGRRGGFGAEHFLVGYREGQPCPACGRPVAKIRTGATASFVCPRCQGKSEPDTCSRERV